MGFNSGFKGLKIFCNIFLPELLLFNHLYDSLFSPKFKNLRSATHAPLFAGNREIYEHQEAEYFADRVTLSIRSWLSKECRLCATR